MSGKSLFEKLSVRDYSGSDADQYAQWLQTIHFQLKMNGQEDDFFKLLEKADEEKKQIVAQDPLAEEFDIDSISLA
ncbi:hypothetical protein [Chryseobacterium sp. MFBS3-17]|uniref:hypothetical protein n=1 Tax=Chryseobacterium sp. MFBS3-17 TaxID=2886689 RepID=UPI001D0EF200|nr:hypothetical protein [Chryseobacterium sp. MFBS3-17]MCC2590347.1 hypothetical protein [Chryseobacterium sp. MFBS3-17]